MHLLPAVKAATQCCFRVRRGARSARSRPTAKQAVYFNIRLGIAYRMVGQFAKGREAYEKAIALDPNYARRPFEFGILFDVYLWDSKACLGLIRSLSVLVAGGDDKVKKWASDLRNRNAAAQSGGAQGAVMKTITVLRSSPRVFGAALALAEAIARTSTRSQIIGNARSARKVLYIVSWKKPLPGRSSSPGPMVSVLDSRPWPPDLIASEYCQKKAHRVSYDALVQPRGASARGQDQVSRLMQ